MEKSLKLIIHRSQIIFDNVSITWNSAIKYLHQNNEKGVKSKPNILDNKLHYKIIAVPLNQRGFNAYLVSLYVNSLIKSNTYRKTAIQVLLEHLSSMTHQANSKYIILIKLRTPKKQFLDYKWNERITKIILETRELDYAMSWLSTLGGAFSALGEEFQHCAQMAGKISVKQFQLALHLGNPLLVARCKLYAALSLIQQDHFLKGLLPSLSKSTHWIPCW
ncbi:uncharacterized protein LOC124947125 isoform X2 [Vespa velutina]|uniref:uncharacterized protein LOC124947125 isoform X2 n=1 Tax=Vespa velutina TaxID=202808 RepID=UPI001FB32775|nr:uncharacterized protein LOC124947125 isoform X2 [Vespa velutina]